MSIYEPRVPAASECAFINCAANILRSAAMLYACCVCMFTINMHIDFDRVAKHCGILRKTRTFDASHPTLVCRLPTCNTNHIGEINFEMIQLTLRVCCTCDDVAASTTDRRDKSMARAMRAKCVCQKHTHTHTTVTHHAGMHAFAFACDVDDDDILERIPSTTLLLLCV